MQAILFSRLEQGRQLLSEPIPIAQLDADETEFLANAMHEWMVQRGMCGDDQAEVRSEGGFDRWHELRRRKFHGGKLIDDKRPLRLKGLLNRRDGDIFHRVRIHFVLPDLGAGSLVDVRKNLLLPGSHVDDHESHSMTADHGLSDDESPERCRRDLDDAFDQRGLAHPGATGQGDALLDPHLA